MLVPQQRRSMRHRAAAGMVMALVAMSLGACTSFSAAGPSSSAVRGAAKSSVDQANIQIIDVTDAVARKVLSASRTASFAEVLGDVPPVGSTIGIGDTIEVSIWESPPAALFGGNATFGSTSTSAILTSSAAAPQRTNIPETMVDGTGSIRIPFAGVIRAAGRTPQQIEREIVARLSGKAHEPQVIVRSAANANSTVTVVGDVSTNTRVPLSPRGERLLDVLSVAGGVSHPVGKTTIQITRGNQVVSSPLEAVIRDPTQNIRMQPHDVVTALFQPFSFTSLGATGQSAEIQFEGTGLSLAQALGRVGGLNAERANVRGVFIFRFEDAAALDPVVAASARRTPDGKIPVIYRVDLSDPATLFVAQSFPIRNKDVLYVSSAPLTDIQRFVSIISSLAFTVIGLGQAAP